MTNRTAARTLPTNIITLLPTLPLDSLGVAADIAHERAVAAPGGSRSSRFWMGRHAAIDAEVGRRGYRLVRADRHADHYNVVTPAEYVRIINNPNRLG